MAKSVDMDKLSYCVAIAETGDCTAGMGITKNNCFGIMVFPATGRTGKWYNTKEESYADFKRIWNKSYVKFSDTGFPTYAMAKTWTGDDDTQTWLNNVTNCYND